MKNNRCLNIYSWNKYVVIFLSLYLIKQQNAKFFPVLFAMGRGAHKFFIRMVVVSVPFVLIENRCVSTYCRRDTTETNPFCFGSTETSFVAFVSNRN